VVNKLKNKFASARTSAVNQFGRVKLEFAIFLNPLL